MTATIESAMPRTVQELAEQLGARVTGRGDVELSGVASLGSATANDLAFVTDERGLPRGLASRAGALIVGEFTNLPVESAKPLLITDQPRLAFARAAVFLQPARSAWIGVHPTAVVAESTRLGRDVSIGAHAVIDSGVVIGNRVSIGPGVSVGAGVAIGDDCDLRAHVTVYPGTRMGSRVVVHAGAVLGSDGFGYVPDRTTGRYEAFPQIGTLEIGDDVEIGANSTVDRGALDATRIGRGVKLDNLVHVGHNVVIGEDVVIAAQTGVSGSTAIGNGVVIAGQVGIADHVRIEDGVILGAQCGVPTGKVVRGQGVVFWGTPARPIRGFLKELAVLARLAKRGRETKET